MNRDAGGMFPVLTPPPGGLHALRARLEQEPARRRRRVHRRVLLAAAAGAAVAVLLLPALHRLPVGGAADLRIDADLNPALVRLGVVEPAVEPVTVPRSWRRRVAVQRVAVDNPRVVFYRVAALPDS